MLNVAIRTIVTAIDVEKVWSEDVCKAPAEAWPELYSGWTPEQLAVALQPLGIKTGQVWGRTPEMPDRRM